MKSNKIAIPFLIVPIFVGACGGSNHNAPAPITLPITSTLPTTSTSTPIQSTLTLPLVRRTTPSPQAWIQFRGNVGNHPQSPFDPNHFPASRAHTGNTRESSGALLYTVVSGAHNQIYVLLGRERRNGLWNFMRGSVDVGHSYVQSAINEIHEETGGVYQVTAEVLLSEPFDVYTTVNVRQNASTLTTYASTFFVKLDYVPATTILQARNQQTDDHFREMTDYAWIRLDDLNSALNNNTPSFNARTILAETQSYNFLPWSFSILRQAYDLGILTHLN